MKQIPTSSVNSTRSVPPTEVVPKAKRRRFTTAYKLRILKEAEACNKRGEIGALLRREGLYSTTLSKWRKQRDEGRLKGAPHPKLQEAQAKIRQLERQLKQRDHTIAQARAVIDVQKKSVRCLA